MKTSTILGLAVAATGLVAASAQANHIWINEFHYDNPGTDTGEFVEIALRSPNASGFTAADYGIQLYNGSNNAPYGSISGNLTTFGTISAPLPVANSTSTITLYSLSFPTDGLQNGSPDGIALVNLTTSTVEEFLTYEGTITAVGGIANGMTSTALTPTEPGVGNTTSLSATGLGFSADQFNAASFALTEVATPGAVNTGQTFTTAVPEPASIGLLGLAGLTLVRRRRTA